MPKHKYIETPEKLLALWDEYKSSVGFDEIEQATPKGDIISLKVKKPYLRSGFEAYVIRKLGFGISQYLDNQDDAYTEYLGVITCIRKEWETDQVSGTMTGRYKAPNLTARLNGFTDKTDVTTNGKDLIPTEIQVEIVKPNENPSD
jgi:hypothetical protein